MSKTYEALKKAEIEKARKTQLGKEELLSSQETVSPHEETSSPLPVWSPEGSNEKVVTERFEPNEQEVTGSEPSSEMSPPHAVESIASEFISLPPTIEEQYQRLYSSLIVRSQRAKPIQTIMVVGAHHGDGVTTSASLFARTLAKSRTVLLVDANLRTPALAQIFNKRTNQGFADFLARKVTLDGAISPTDIPSLFLMTSGAAPLALPYLFETGNFDQLLTDLKERFDSIIFDAAPLANHLDSIFLASRVDGVLLVIKAESTQVPIGLEIKKLLDEAGARVLGAIVNQPQEYIPQFFRRFVA
jgi:capsular exopolysaccharide synthesis family protein